MKFDDAFLLMLFDIYYFILAVSPCCLLEKKLSRRFQSTLGGFQIIWGSGELHKEVVV